MKSPIKAYVGIFTPKRGKAEIVRIDVDRGYVWDGIFEDVHDRFGYDIWPDGLSRSAIIREAKKLGYSVKLAGVIIVDD